MITNDISDIHKYLMGKEHNIKQMFGIIKQVFIELLSSIVNASNHTKCVYFIILIILIINQKFKIQPTLVNLHPNEYSQEFHYYPFAVKLDRCVAGYNTLNDWSNKVCNPNKTEDLNLSIFNMITSINTSKPLAKHILCECKCKLDGKKCNLNQW